MKYPICTVYTMWMKSLRKVIRVFIHYTYKTFQLIVKMITLHYTEMGSLKHR